MISLLDELTELRRAAELGEDFPTDVLADVLQDLPQRTAGLSRRDLEAVSEEISLLMDIAGEEMDNIRRRLHDIAKGREGIQGYNHLQAHHRAQRLSKRA